MESLLHHVEGYFNSPMAGIYSLALGLVLVTQYRNLVAQHSIAAAGELSVGEYLKSL
jgi:hypothetical protein